MPAQMQNAVTRRDHARGRGPHDHWIRTAEAHRLQAEAIAKGVHWVWTNARRIVERLMNDTPAPGGSEIPTTFAGGRYSFNFVIADAISRGILRLTRLVRRSLLEPYHRRRRRKIAIAQQETMDDRQVSDIALKRSEPTGTGRHELPRAA
jgi:hypothetical protein